MSQNTEQEKLPLWQVIKSALAALFGVQSNAARERDFAKGTPGQFVIVGLLAAIVFVLVLVAVVFVVLHLTGAG